MIKLTTERLEYYSTLPTAPVEGEGFFKKGIFMYEVRRMAQQLLAYEQAPAQPVIPEQAKPVAYTDNRNLKRLQKGCNTALLWTKHNAEVGDIPLYTEVPAQPVSEPYKSNNWIKCSERMPADGFDVLCTAEFNFPGDWRRKVGYLRNDGGWFIYGGSWEPTHWMPLPVAPAQESEQ